MAQREIVKLEEFPSNSFSSKEKALEKKEKKVERIVKKTATKRKKTVGERFADAFLKSDGESVGEYILYDVLIPAAKDTFHDIIVGGLEMLFNGDAGTPKNRRVTRDADRTYVSYRSYYEDRSRRPSRETSRRRPRVDDILLESRQEADAVLGNMVDIINEFEVVSVADLYQMVGIHTEFTDNNFGWDNLNAAYVERTRGGYRIHLPKPILLDD